MNHKKDNYKKAANTLGGLLQKRSAEFSIELKNILSFWLEKGIDLKQGGIIGEMDHYGHLVENASKGCILNCRVLYTFSAAYRFTKDERYKVFADRIYTYIIKHFWDHNTGGLHWEVDHKGSLINSKKQAYAQGFGIYAFSEYYRACHRKESLTYAQNLYHILEDHYLDLNYLGYIESLSHDWKEMGDRRLSDKDLNAAKSMNTHLHILEPYTNLYRVWPNKRLKKSISSLLSIFHNNIFDANSKHLNLFFDKDWTVLSTEFSFGHDIEGAWLLREAKEVIEFDQATLNIDAMANSLVEVTIKEGLDKDGSIFNERQGTNYDKDKHWWQQVEAMVGFLDAYEQQPNQMYLDRIDQTWEFIKNNFLDRENGGWFWRLDENNQPYDSEVKMGFWKCPYHSGRAMMELIKRINRISIKTNI